MGENIYIGPYKFIWKIFTLVLCKCILKNTQQQYKHKCKKFRCVNVNDVHYTGFTHRIYVYWHVNNTNLYVDIVKKKA
jgi:hypothetical protein